MYFTINLAFAHYLDQLDETIDVPIERNWIHEMYVLPISIESFNVSSSLLQAPKTLKEYITNIKKIENHWSLKKRP